MEHEKEQLIADMKKLSPFMIIEVLKRLIDDDHLKQQHDKLLPKLHTKLRKWKATMDRTGMAMPSSSKMDVSVRRHMSISSLPFSMTLTRVPRVIFCGTLYQNGILSFAAAQPSPTHSGGHELMYMNINLQMHHHDPRLITPDLFLRFMLYLSRHVQTLIVYHPNDALQMEKLFRSRGYDFPFRIEAIASILEVTVRGLNKFIPLKQLMDTYAEKIDDGNKLPAAVQFVLDQYMMIRKDEDNHIRMIRTSLTDAKALFVLFDRNRGSLTRYFDL
jgi:hypothetical protein